MHACLVMRSAARLSPLHFRPPASSSRPRLVLSASKSLAAASGSLSPLPPPYQVDGPVPRVPDQPYRPALRKPASQNRDGPQLSTPGLTQRRKETDHTASGRETSRADDRTGPSDETFLVLWDRLTRRCVLSSAVLLALSFTPMSAIPDLPAGTATQSISAWTDTLQSAFAFMVLVTVFAGDHEAEATFLHAVGAAGQLAALLQAFLAGAMPVTAMLLCASFAFAAVVFNTAQVGVVMPELIIREVSGLVDSMSSVGTAAWVRWQAFLGCVGLALVPQAFSLAFAPASWGAAPAAMGAAVGIVVTVAVTQASALPGACTNVSPASSLSTDRRNDAAPTRGSTPSKGDLGSAKDYIASGGASSKPDSRDVENGLGRWLPFWATVPAWTATLLLMLEPAKLLVGHAAGHSSLAGAGIAAPALACVGNALLVPRALRLRNGMFLTATTWGTAGAWLVTAASLSTRQAGGRAWAAFSGCTALLALFGWQVRRGHLTARSAELEMASGKQAASWFVAPPMTRTLRSTSA